MVKPVPDRPQDEALQTPFVGRKVFLRHALTKFATGGFGSGSLRGSSRGLETRCFWRSDGPRKDRRRGSRGALSARGIMLNLACLAGETTEGPYRLEKPEIILANVRKRC